MSNRDPRYFKVYQDGDDRELEQKIQDILESGAAPGIDTIAREGVEEIQRMIENGEIGGGGGGAGVDPVARQEIQEVSEQLADTARKSQLSDSNKLNLTPYLIDMHFDSLKGVGWVGETSDSTKYPITSSASKGTKVINANNTAFIPGQLICYTAKDGMYYSGVVSAITNTQITLKTPLEHDVDNKCFVMAFYQNFSHGNKYGNATIADYAIRSMYTPNGLLTHRIPPSKWVKYGSSHSTLVNARKTSDYSQPFGVDDVVNAQITTQNWGVQLDFTIEKAGLTKISLNVSADADGEIQLLISEYPTIIKYYANKILTNSNVVKKETFYANLDAGEYSIFLLSKKASGTANVFIGATEIYHCQNNYDRSEFNKGFHMLLGDSWFYNDGFAQRLQEHLPDATISNWGIGGNYLPNLINRFRGTATPSDVNNDPTRYAGVMDATKLPKIDYVWVMVGTNDYYGSSTAANFKKQLAELIDLIVARGAKPIIFNTSVGAIENGKLDISRQYADMYFNLSPNIGTTKNYVLNFIKMTVPTGKSILAVGGQFTALTRIYIDEIYFDYAENKEIEITFDDDVVNVNSPMKSQSLKTAYTKKLDFGSPPSSLWFNVVAVNNTGSSATYTGYIRFRVSSL